MRKIIDLQMEFWKKDIADVEFDPQSRDEIPKLLMGLQYIYRTPLLLTESGLSRIGVARDHPSKQGPHPLYIIYPLIFSGFSDRAHGKVSSIRLPPSFHQSIHTTNTTI
jgi:hypothetical protein